MVHGEVSIQTPAKERQPAALGLKEANQLANDSATSILPHGRHGCSSASSWCGIHFQVWGECEAPIWNKHPWLCCVFGTKSGPK